MQVIRMLAICCIIIQQSHIAIAKSDTVRVYFPFNESLLTTPSIKFLDSLALKTPFFKEGQIFINGYADFIGTTDYNNILSLQRAENVKAYLDYLKVQAVITGYKGQGKVERRLPLNEHGFAEDRVVAIIRLLPDSKKPISKLGYESSEADVGHIKFLNVNPDSGPAGFYEFTEEENRRALSTSNKPSTSAKPLAGTTVIESSEGSSSADHLHHLQSIVLHNAKPHNHSSYYSNIAIELSLSYALEGKFDSTFILLNSALDNCTTDTGGCREIWSPNILGFYQYERYHRSKKWKSFEGRILTHFNARKDIHNHSGAIELIKYGGADQSIRVSLPVFDIHCVQRFKTIDSQNTVFIRQYILKHGFPKQSEVGPEASEAAFLLVQHLQNDTALQKSVLNQMEALPKNELDKEVYAMLTDRYLVNTQGYQLYGTQFQKSASGNKLFPVKDIGNLNKRRKEAGLELLSIKH